MKQLLEVRSNAHYTQPESEKDEFELKAWLELVIIHTNGKKYEVKGKSIVTETAIAESRFIVSPEMLTQLISDLQMQQKKMEGIRHNAEKLTSLVRYVSQAPEENK